MAKSKLYTTYYRDAQVFRDTNGNGVLDEPGEILLRTDGNGAFSAPDGKGRFVLQGGFDINSGEENPYNLLSAPKAARSIGALNSVWQALLDRGATQPKIKKLVGLPSTFALNKYNALRFDDIRDKNQEIGVRKEGQVDVLTQWVSRIAETTFGARFAEQGLVGEALKAALRAAEDKVIGDFAQSLLNLGLKTVNLSDRAVVRTLLESTLSLSDIDLTAAELDAAAQAASEINGQFNTAPIGRLDELAIIGANSARVFGVRDFATLTAEYTGANLTDQIQNNDIYIPAPTDLGLADDTGAGATDGITRDNTPTLSGRASVAADHVNVYRDGVKVGEAPIANGAWSFASPALLDGRYDFTFKGVNELGQEGGVSVAKTVTVDTVAPAVPTVTPLRTADSTPTVQGTWRQGAGETLSVQIDGRTYTAANGLIVSGNAWSLTLPAALTPGKREVLAQATDAAGNASQDTSANELEILAPANGFTLISDAPAGVAVREGDSIDFTIAPSGGAVTEDTVLTLDLTGTAIGGAKGQASAADFDPARQTVVFLANATAPQTVTVIVSTDGVAEGMEGYQAALSQDGVILATLVGTVDDVTNAAPTVSGVADVAGAVGATIALPDIKFSDAENDALAVTVTASGGSVNGLTDADPATPGIQLTGTPAAVTAAFAGATFVGQNAGAGKVALSVSDGVNAPTAAAVGVTLTAVPTSVFELSGPTVVVEGTQVVYSVSRTGDASQPAIVDFALSPAGGATQADYAALSVVGATVSKLSGGGGTLAFAAGSTKADITLSIVADGIAETGETLAVGLKANASDPSKSAVSDTKGSLSISIQDPPTSTFELSGPTAVVEGDQVVYSVSRTGDLSQSAIVDFTLLPGGGATQADYAALSVVGATVSNLSGNGGTLAFAAGASKADITVSVVADGVAETGETLAVGLKANAADPSKSQIDAAKGSLSISIQDPPPPPPTTFSFKSSASAGATTREGETLTFSITPDGPVTADTSLTFNLSGAAVGAVGNTASAADFSLTGQTLVFKAGQTGTQTVTVAVAADGAKEGPEGYRASLLDSGSKTLATVDGLIDDPANSAPSISGTADASGTARSTIALADAKFADADQDKLTVTVAATGGTVGGLTDADPTTAGIQLTGTPEAVTAAFAAATFVGANPGAAQVALSVSDGVNPPTTATIGVALTATSIFELSGPIKAVEGDRLVYTVARVGDASQAAVVDFAFAPGGGASQADYAALGVVGADVSNLSGSGGTLSFPAGSTKADITVSVVADGVAETGETLVVSLKANPADTSGSAVGDTKNSLSIALQDPPASVFELSGPTAVTEGDRVVYTVARVGDSSQAALVNFTFAPGGGASQADYAALGVVGADVSNLSGSGGTLSFPAGSSKADIALSIVQDGIAETGETLTVGLLANPADPSGAGVSSTKSSLSIAIQDAEKTVDLSSGTVQATGAPETFVYDYATINGRATKAGDGEVRIDGFDPTQDKLVFHDVNGINSKLTEAQFLALPGVVASENPFSSETSFYFDPVNNVLGGVKLTGILDSQMTRIVAEFT